MTIQLLWQGFVVGVAVGMPAVMSFFTGSSLGAGGAGWARLKSMWAVTVAVGFTATLALLWSLQSEFLSFWMPICGVSTAVCFIAYALGAKLANPGYQPDGKDPLGLAVEAVIVVGLSAVAGFVWNILPGGQESGWIFGILLMAFVGYVYFVYDDKPKWDVMGDMPLLIVSFGIEVGMLLGLAVIGLLVFAGLFVIAASMQADSSKTWLGQEGLFQTLLLVFWALANLLIRWAVQEPKEKLRPTFLHPR